MSSRCLDRLVVAVAFAAAAAGAAAHARELRVCADPDNLPYSHRDESGFENAIAKVLARAIDAHAVFVWQPQGRGYVRKTLNAGVCDVIVGVPAHYDPVRTTRPYYRSSYVAVMRGGFGFHGFDDPGLRQARIGVQLIGDDQAATPPGLALAERGIVDNVVGYPVYGEGRQGERMVRDLVDGRLDVALLWGPQGAYFASRAALPLAVAPVARTDDLVPVPFEYAIAVGVRKRDAGLQQALDAALVRSRDEIDAILAAYDVPRTDPREAGRSAERAP